MELFNNTEIITNIALYVPLKQLYRLQRINTKCYHDLSSNHFWKLKFIRDFNDNTIMEDTWEKTYIQYKPRRPGTPFTMYCSNNITRLRKAYPNDMPAHLARKMAIEWSKRTNEMTQKYVTLSDKSKTNYSREMAICEQNQIHKPKKGKKYMNMPVYSDSDDTSSEDSTTSE